MKSLIGLTLELKEMPQLRFETPNLTVGNKYTITGVDGSNVWIKDDDGIQCSIGSCRFILP